MIGRLSIRTRVLIAMFAVFAATLVAIFALVTTFYKASIERHVEQRLKTRVTLAQQLSAEGASANTIVLGLADSLINVHLDLTNGTNLGAPLPTGDPAEYRYVRVLLNGPGNSELDQAQLTVWTNSDVIHNEVRNLDRTLVVISVVALLVAGVLIVLTIDVALKPLATMAERARRISQGERGIRMGAPTDTTEVGRTANAIDGMLDELEGAMARAGRAEKRAKESRDQMQQFMSDAAHELKTPTAGIQAAAEALVQMPDDADPNERDELTYLLGREAHRSGQLVASLLEAARVDSGVELVDEQVDLDDLLAAERVNLSLARPQVEFKVTADPMVVQGDRRALTSVVRNVAENAARAAAASPHGWVAIDLQRRTDDRGQWAVVTVTDSGRGIAVEDRERVFDRLVRLSETASTAPGSGLGLAIARGYARAHGGDVRHAAEGEVIGVPEGPHGAVFVIELPLPSMPRYAM